MSRQKNETKTSPAQGKPDGSADSLLAALADLKIALVEVNKPPNAGTGDVTEIFSGMCFGSVWVEGKAEKPGSQLPVNSVFVQVNGGMPQMAAVDEITHKWKVQMQGARCLCNGAGGDNTVTATANWYQIVGGMQIPEMPEIATTTFIGNCIPPAKARKPIQKSAAATALVEPVHLDDGWLEYRDMLTPNSLLPGKVLGYNGAPLSASVIAVYVSHVQWRNHGQLGVRRAIGSAADVSSGIEFTHNGTKFVLFREPYRFFELPKESIVLFQPGGTPSKFSETPYVVLSECGRKPDVFDVFRDQPIRTRVNDSIFPFTPHTGTYHLRVKVIA